MAELTMQDMVQAEHAGIQKTASPHSPALQPAEQASSGAVVSREDVAAAPQISEQRFTFTGTGAEYFRIWVVNVLLTLATLGVYSAWAKVRRLQYFYRNTRVAGAVFDYRGNPKAILKGRAVALVLLLAYKIAFDISAVAAIAVLVVLAAILPWLLSRAFRFKMVNSTYRNVRFHFRGTVGQAYRMLILFPIVFGFTGFFLWSVITSFGQRPGIGLILVSAILPLVVLAGTVPAAHYLLKRYQHDNAYFGVMPFFFRAEMKEFFKIYAKAVGCFFLGGFVVGIFGVLTHKLNEALQATMFGWLFGFLYGALTAYISYLFVRAYLEGKVQNLVWNHTELGFMRFESTIRVRRLLSIHATNLLLITLTLGLYKPFAMVRLAKYRVESLTLVAGNDLEEFLADHSADNADASGEEAGEFFDIDIAL
jgi:uncharacterized membrane protein YjgN (DUF898 family)